MNLQRLGLYARTLAGLRPVQWAYMPLRRIQARLPTRVPAPSAHFAGAELAPAVEMIGVDRSKDVVERANAVADRTFTFLGHTERLPEIRWRHRYVSHLWSYNLHYFDYARDLAWAHRESPDGGYAVTFTELALSWVRGTDPGRGDGWEPYAVSLRLVNWLYALSLLGRAVPPPARSAIVRSAGQQAAWLERRLEKHIQANHLQKNWQALAVAGLFFEGKAALRWRRNGMEGSWHAVRRHVLGDGVHFERSPMYHAIALADFLELTALCDGAGEAVPEDVRERVGQMAEAFGALSRPDGSLHLFNDAANGIAPSRGHLARMARDILGRGMGTPTRSWALPDGGYYGFGDPDTGERLMVDCGPAGPRHQPAHAHCDLLSFELDLAGRPVVVDAGVHGYGGDPFREYARSTRAHNTVSIDGREQSEPWDTFRMARMATPRRARIVAADGGFRFIGGARHVGGGVHRREIERLGPGRWLVTDRVEGGTRASSFLHLHPTFTVEKCSDGARARGADLVLQIAPFGIREWQIRRGERDPVQGWFFPAFGRALTAPTVVFEADAGHAFGYEITLKGAP